jgi:hypothetical protein
MPGYYLIEAGSPLPPAVANAEADPERLGFMDFLRELAGEEADVQPFWTVVLVGLEDLLFMAGPDAESLALDIRRRLRAAASLLERRNVTAVVEVRGTLQRGAELRLEYRNKQLPLGHIFGAPHPQTYAGGRHFFSASFNLTNGG